MFAGRTLSFLGRMLGDFGNTQYFNWLVMAVPVFEKEINGVHWILTHECVASSRSSVLSKYVKLDSYKVFECPKP